MKILFSADQHIKLGQDKVPKEFQKNRFMLLADSLNKIAKDYEVDLHIIGGDLLDVASPSTEEIELMHAFLDKLDHKGIIYTGNHEMLSKTISCLSHLSAAITNATQGRWKVVNEEFRSTDFDIVPYSHLHKAKWKENKSKLCFTHVRGAIEPHVVPEIELSRFSEYYLVCAGDLHSYKNTQAISDSTQLIYPGSPLTTSFHRERTKGTNGVFIIDTDTLEYEWVELGQLPQLIRKTINVSEEMIPDAFDRVIYEVEGNVSELKAIKNSELLDKRLNTKISKDAKLNLQNLPIIEELALYLEDVQKLDTDTIQRLKGVAAKYVKYND